MKKILLTSLLFGLSISVFAAGDAENGRKKTVSCAACHNADGNSSAPGFPKLAGQHAEYIVKQLKDYQSGARENAIMKGIASALSEQDMIDIAAYYASQSAKIGTTADAQAQLGGNVYRGGVTLTSIPACIACHGPSGRGNGPAGFPALAGQHAEYTYSQLMAFKNGTRSNDINKMMRQAVNLMSEQEMRAVSEYIQGLYQ